MYCCSTKIGGVEEHVAVESAQFFGAWEFVVLTTCCGNTELQFVMKCVCLNELALSARMQKEKDSQ